MPKKRIVETIVQKNDFYKYFFILIFVFLAFLSFMVLRPFVNTILASLVIAYIFYLPFTWLYKIVKNKTISALLMSLLLLILLVVPILLVMKLSTDEAQYVYLRTKQQIMSGEIIKIDCPDGIQTAYCRVATRIKSFLITPDVQYYLKDTLSRTTTYVINKTSEFIIGLPSIILKIFIIFFLVFYLLKDGPELAQRFKKFIPMTEVHQGHIYKKMKDTAFAVIYGAIVIAIIQGVLAGIGMWVVGINGAWFWGVIMVICALVPFFGTSLVWFPAAVLLILQGAGEGNAILIWKGIGLILYGGIFVGGIDNIIKPKIIGTKAGMHPVLVLLGVLGGMYLFGFAGFLIGPMILAASKSFLDLYEKERVINHNETKI